jgi:hypothetical protein
MSVTFRRILSFVLVSLLFAIFSAPFLFASLDSSSQITDGEELIKAMYEKYKGKWYDKLKIVQKVTFYRNGEEQGSQIWTEFLDLPGKVRSNIGPSEEGNAEIYLHGEFHRFQNGKRVGGQKAPHPVLCLGFDVYLQEPEKSIAMLKEVPYDLSKIHQTVWQERPVYVVGADKDDFKPNQFWIDKEHLYFVRTIFKSPRGTLLDIEMNKIVKLGEGWIATQLIFKRSGEIILKEDYQENPILDKVDPAVFDVENFKK